MHNDVAVYEYVCRGVCRGVYECGREFDLMRLYEESQHLGSVISNTFLSQLTILEVEAAENDMHLIE